MILLLINKFQPEWGQAFKILAAIWKHLIVLMFAGWWDKGVGVSAAYLLICMILHATCVLQELFYELCKCLLGSSATVDKWLRRESGLQVNLM